MEKETDILYAAKGAFDVSDTITGILTGGTVAPRRLIRSVDVNNRADLIFTYQDGVYHDTRAGKEFTESYLLKDGILSVIGKKTLFPIDKEDPFFDLAEPYITQFCDEYGVKAKGYEKIS